jgi:hypothetical protein
MGDKLGDFWDWVSDSAGSAVGTVIDFFKTDDGGVDWAKIAPLLGTFLASRADESSTIADFMGLDSDQGPMGYMEGIPEYEVMREPVAGTYDPERRPGSRGQRYFTQTRYAPLGEENQAEYDAAKAATTAGLSTLQTQNAALTNTRRPTYGQTNEQIQAQIAAVKAGGASPDYQNREIMDYGNRYGLSLSQLASAGGVPYGQARQEMQRLGGIAAPRATDTAAYNPQTIQNTLNRLIAGSTPRAIGIGQGGGSIDNVTLGPGIDADAANNMGPQQTGYAQGGIASVVPQGQGYYLGGPTDGMADQIPATVDGMQPAALSDGEFVIPADVVSHLGNGNSDSGAQNLYSMMERVRKDRTGNPNQGRQIDPNKYLA